MISRTIPYLSFDGMHDAISDDLKAAASRVIDSKWYILGQEVKGLESQFSNYVGCQFGIGLNSGLDALIISLRCLGIGEGDEVIVSSNAYIACWNAIVAVGATIVPVEPDPISFNIDSTKLESSITSRTKAIMAVHLYGRMCDMEEIMKIADSHNVYVVEDNAQSQGAEINGRKSASIGHINATSFYPGKNLGALGDAGMITTNNAEWAEKAAALRNYGCHKKYYNDYIGMNSRLDEMQAAMVAVKLRHLNKWNRERQFIAKRYSEVLSESKVLSIPNIPAGDSHVCHIYCIRTKQRDELQQYLKDQGIGTIIHYPVPPHLQKSYAYLGFKKGDFPIAEAMANECLSLPIYPGLREEEISYISDCILSFSPR